jgi:hypothetical protein
MVPRASASGSAQGRSAALGADLSLLGRGLLAPLPGGLSAGGDPCAPLYDFHSIREQSLPTTFRTLDAS